jgi:hypothetical protein
MSDAKRISRKSVAAVAGSAIIPTRLFRGRSVRGTVGLEGGEVVSRRANILLLLALAVGVAYGRFGVPFLAAIGSEAVVEEPEEQCLPEADAIGFRMKLLKSGMDHDEVRKVLGLTGQPHTVSTLYNVIHCYPVRPHHNLYVGCIGNSLFTAELYDRHQLVVRAPAD